MATPIKIKLNSGKPFPSGEIPAAFTHTYKDSNGAAIDLSGYSAEMFITGPTETTDYATGTLDIDLDPTTGIVQYVWSGDEFVEVGTYSMIIWVGDGGTNRFGSDLVIWSVYDPPGDVPTV